MIFWRRFWRHRIPLTKTQRHSLNCVAQKNESSLAAKGKIIHYLGVNRLRLQARPYPQHVFFNLLYPCHTSLRKCKISVSKLHTSHSAGNFQRPLSPVPVSPCPGTCPVVPPWRLWSDEPRIPAVYASCRSAEKTTTWHEREVTAKHAELCTQARMSNASDLHSRWAADCRSVWWGSATGRNTSPSPFLLSQAQPSVKTWLNTIQQEDIALREKIQSNVSLTDQLNVIRSGKTWMSHTDIFRNMEKKVESQFCVKIGFSLNYYSILLLLLKSVAFV